MLRITISNASVTREGRKLLDGASIAIAPGSHTAVLGPNGAGKTTLLRVIRGEVPPDNESGRTYETENGVQNDPLGLRHRIGMVSGDMQDFYEHSGSKATGREIVLAGFFDSPLLYEQPDAKMLVKADTALRRMRAAELAEVPARAMSTGQLRRVLLARACAPEPDVILLDECMDGLDKAARATAMELLETLAKRATLVVTAHRGEDVPSCIRQTVHLRDAAGHEKSGEHSRCPALPQPGPMKFIVRIRKADVVMHGRNILHDIDFTMRPGEAWAVSGDNGAGKSTFLKLILGDVAPFADEGTVERFGGCGTGEAHRRRMAVVSPEMHGLFARLPHCRDTVLETVLSGMFGTVGLYETPSADQQDRARELLAFSGLTELAGRRMETLSHGQRRRVLLTRAIAGEPWLLLLDEPLSGLDAESRQSMGNTLDRLIRCGMPVIMISHHEGDFPQSATHRLRLAHGRIVSTDRRS